MKKAILFSVISIVAAGAYAGNNNQKAVTKLDKGEASGTVSSPARAKVNESVLIGNSANAYAWQASGTNQIYYDVASNTLAVTKRRGSLDTAIPSGSGRIVNHMSTDAGATWSAGLEVNGTLAPQVFGRHPNVAILPSGELITQWAELYPMGAGFSAIGVTANKLSDNSLLSAYIDTLIITEIDDVAGLDTVTYSVPDEIFVDEANGTFYFGGAADNATNTNYLWKSSDKGASHQLVKLWKDAAYGGVIAGANPTHGDFTGSKGNYIMSVLPDSAYAVANGLDYETYAPYLVRFENGSITEEGFVDLGAIFTTLGIDSWTYEWDMVTDKDGNWHMFIQGYLAGETEDTNVGIYEIYSNTPGRTDIGAMKVADITLVGRVIDAANTLNGTADIHASRDAEGKYVFVKYLDWDPTDDPETSTEMFVSGRAISSETYADPIAVNDNDFANQNFTQSAPRVSALGAGDAAGTMKFQIHSSWVEFGGTPAAGTAAANLFYVGPTLDVAEYSTGTGIEENFRADQFELLGNYPNPFNPSTNLRFTTPQAGNLTFEVFNVLGQKVTSFTFMATRSGLHEAAFDAKNLASGSYVIRMSAAGFTRSMNVLLAK
ncbi:MAG: T9SS type A sorting domain-containing protein [Bacteroidetes bacterium]|nr:T9SS type A sorting domain-containing protein [Bacteroidota bacterium]